MTSTPLTRGSYGTTFSNDAAQNYQQYFEPVIAGPFALDLVNEAGLRPGGRVLDVATGTGTVARLAAERVTGSGRVTGIDVSPGMLTVARSLPTQSPVKWYETAAESVPLPDSSFDVVFCALGLQFFSDQAAALREMFRVLRPDGRVYISTPMPNAFFDVLDRAIARHVSEDASAFVHAVFSLDDAARMGSLLGDAGFSGVAARPRVRTVQLPSPRDFMWQYIYCTPLMALVPESDSAIAEALERDVVAGWQPWVSGEGMRYEQSVLMSTARRVG